MLEKLIYIITKSFVQCQILIPDFTVCIVLFEIIIHREFDFITRIIASISLAKTLDFEIYNHGRKRINCK